jgi:glycogen operon protein
LANPPLLESLAHDPILGRCKLVAEAWDAGGLYQVGSFPAYGRWAEWNGKYRDEMRQWLKGEPGLVGALSQRLQGSPDLYGWNRRGPTASINFISCHDGFTLYDLFAYNEKHNWANGEDNRDGGNDNHSWNCGREGETDDPDVNALRARQLKNAWALLMVSHGVPMVLMGDEMARTQQGNNNTYCHDNELNWLDWTLLEKHPEMFRFAKQMIAFRHAHPVLRPKEHLQSRDYKGCGCADVTWHGTQAWTAEWSAGARALAFMLCGNHAKGGLVADDHVYVAVNTYWDALRFELPRPPGQRRWHVFANTGMPHPQDIFEPGREPRLDDEAAILLGPRSVAILVGR